MKEMLIAEKLIRQKEVEFCIDKENHSNKVHHLEMTAKSEKLTRDQEQTQLICMMGNVAHDLKTPLHSIQVRTYQLQTAHSTF
jgi:K+-sensing histidine kinase KdpD